MLCGEGSAEPNRRSVVDGIVKFFFGEDFRKGGDLPPPFFRRERTADPKFCACPYDAAEGEFYFTSLAREYVFKEHWKVRWFIASGGDYYRDMGESGERNFRLWAQRVTAAACFGMDLTYVVPEESTGKTLIHRYLERLKSYAMEDSERETFLHRYPELTEVVNGNGIAEQMQKHLHTVHVEKPGEPEPFDAARLWAMFPLRHRSEEVNKESSPACGWTFLNPWLRFHWVDRVDSFGICEPLFAAIAYNSSRGKTTLQLVEPESMTQYIKWLSAFGTPGGQREEAPSLTRPMPSSGSPSGVVGNPEASRGTAGGKKAAARKQKC